MNYYLFMIDLNLYLIIKYIKKIPKFSLHLSSLICTKLPYGILSALIYSINYYATYSKVWGALTSYNRYYPSST